MILGHIFGIPVEETLLQFSPGGAATAAVIGIASRSALSRLLSRIRRH
jgi:hypothetical protein